jgi:signal transduction histidine kinase
LVSLISLYDKANPASYENEEIIVNFEYSINLLNETLHDLMEAVKIRDEVNKKYEVIKFEDILSSVQWRLHPLLSEKTVKIVSDFSSMSTIYYPKVDLESIFYNFISNSVRFSSNDRECFINITSGLKDEFAILVFEDNGLGIDLERYRSRLFGLYQRFHHQNTGKGLGLYLLNTQIKSMGGTIEVESKVDIGTKFTVKIKMRKSS